MILKYLRHNFLPHIKYITRYGSGQFRLYRRSIEPDLQTTRQDDYEIDKSPPKNDRVSVGMSTENDQAIPQIFPSSRVVPMLLQKKDTAVLSFDDVPGPKTLKYLSNVRQYLSEVGTQISAATLTLGLNLGNLIRTKKPVTMSSALFDKYGPVVRFVSPLGGDIVLINSPDHIQKVFAMEGSCPVRSTLDSLDKYRKEHRSHVYGGLYTGHGEEWKHQRSLVYTPLQDALNLHTEGIYDVCEAFTQKVYNLRNHQDEIPNDLYKEVHKWAFDCIGLLIFAKKFNMLDREVVYSECDMSWLYHSLENATKAILKCESGLHVWKLFPTPAWYSLVKHCDNVDNIIGKHVLEVEQSLSIKPEENIMKSHDFEGQESLISSMLCGKMSAEDAATTLMDMLIIGVNTVTSTMSFLLYNLAKYQKCQKLLYQEIETTFPEFNMKDIKRLKEESPYLQACIKETLRLVPPIPVLTRVLPKNITLDRYNIPRGTLIIMSTRDASVKESNYDDANKFNPERWLRSDANDYHAFASVPFGFGARKCLGQNIAETMLSVLTVKLLQKYHIEYHYGDIEPSKTFICKPNKAVKVRFIDKY